MHVELEADGLGRQIERGTEAERRGWLIDAGDVEPGLGVPAVGTGRGVALEREDGILADQRLAELDPLDMEPLQRGARQAFRQAGRCRQAEGLVGRRRLGLGGEHRRAVHGDPLGAGLLDQDLAGEQAGRADLDPGIVDLEPGAGVVGEPEAAEPDVERQEALELVHLGGLSVAGQAVLDHARDLRLGETGLREPQDRAEEQHGDGQDGQDREQDLAQHAGAFARRRCSAVCHAANADAMWCRQPQKTSGRPRRSRGSEGLADGDVELPGVVDVLAPIDRHGDVEADRAHRCQIADADAGAELPGIAELRQLVLEGAAAVEEDGTLDLLEQLVARLDTGLEQRAAAGRRVAVERARGLERDAADRSAAAGIEALVGRDLVDFGADDGAGGGA